MGLRRQARRNSGVTYRRTLEFYTDDDGQWRWRFIAGNHRIVADSGQGYSSRRAAEKGWRSMSRAENYNIVGLD